MATIVVYGGGFQPFHVGHLSSYLQAKKAFPDAAFYVAASNDTKQRPIPFKDKQFLAQQAGVKDPMVETRNPINPVEILSQYNPERDVYIIVRSERDPMPYTKKDGSPAYYQPYVPGEPMQPFGKHGYVFVSKKHTFMVGGQEIYSGTQVRDMYTKADDKGRLELIHELYPNSKQQQTIKQMLDKYLAAPAPVADIKTDAMSKLKQKKLAEQINKIRPLLKEANTEQKLKLMKLMKSALSESRIMDRDARINAYYVSRKGDRHKVAENIPYYLLDKLVPLLTKKYAITMNDIEVRPADKNQYRRTSQPEMADEGISRRGILKGIGAAAATGAAGKASAIAGAIPTPSHQQAMYKAMADSNKAQARADAAAKAKADAERLQKNTELVDKEQRVNHHKLDEFAPSDDGDNGQEDMFFKYAKLWYNGNLQVQQRIEEVLAKAGWEIGELESEEGGAFIVQSGDEDGDTYMGWSREDLGGQLNEFAPGNGDDGLPYAEYQVYQCNPIDQFDWIGGPLYQTDSMGMAHKYAYEQYVKHRPKAFMIWQERSQGSRGNYGVKGESDHDEDDLNEDYLDEK